MKKNPYKTKIKNPYSEIFLKQLQENTFYNQHSKNLWLISKKGNLSTEKQAKDIYDRHEKRGYLEYTDGIKRAKLFRKAYKEIEDKYGDGTSRFVKSVT